MAAAGTLFEEMANSVPLFVTVKHSSRGAPRRAGKFVYLLKYTLAPPTAYHGNVVMKTVRQSGLGRGRAPREPSGKPTAKNGNMKILDELWCSFYF